MKKLGKLKKLIFHLRLYWIAAWAFETYRLVVKPKTHGSLVAVWYGEELLMVQASYREELSLPGGWVDGGEDSIITARRELDEELGMQVDSCELVNPRIYYESSKRGTNTVTIYELFAQSKDNIRIDGLEIVGAMWMSPEQALKSKITGHLRSYLNDWMLCKRTKCVEKNN